LCGIAAVLGFTLVAGVPRYALAVTSENASGTFTAQPLAGNQWQYDITLTDNSTVNNANTTIGTFWFSWIPGKDFMEAMPTNVSAPSGWNFLITGSNNASDGNAIQWVATAGHALTAGQTLSGFNFKSTESPAQLLGPSSFGAHQPETLAAAYVGAPFSDTSFGGDVFTLTQAATVSPVPLPPAAIPSLLLLSILGLIAFLRHTRAAVI
jgi:hypothetical protein